MKVLITSGGTIVPIDSVRHIGNMSKGTFGVNLTEQFISSGRGQILFFRARDSKRLRYNPPSYIYQEDTFYTYEDYVSGVVKNVTSFQPDVVISAAAVSDYTVDPIEGKISSSDEITLKLKPVAKVLPLIKFAKPDVKLIGLKLLVGATKHEMREAAYRQMEKCGSDMVAANDLAFIKQGVRKYNLFYRNGDEVEIGGGSLYVDFVKAVVDLHGQI